MLHDRLFIEFDEDTRWVSLRTESRSGLVESDGFELPAGFSLRDVQDSLLATGFVAEVDGDLMLPAQTGCQALRHMIGEIFSYFSASNQPTSRLLRTKQSVDDYLLNRGTAVTLPLWAYAWLDMTVREDLADEARSVQDLWITPDVTLEIQKHREQRVAEVLDRYSTGVEATMPRMAPSLRTRTVSGAKSNTGTHG